MAETARYDAVAEFYTAGWTDDISDPASVCLLEMLGPVAGGQVLEIACGHGRVSRELARRGAAVTAVDVSGALIDKAEDEQRGERLGIRYLRADVAGPVPFRDHEFSTVVCNFGLSDIDDLDGTLANVHRSLRPGGAFVFSILHPCFPGAVDVSGSWPSGGSYYDERWWRPHDALSTLRHKVGANHRTLSTYLNSLHRHGLALDEVGEPAPPPSWAGSRPDAARGPVFFVARCLNA